MMQGKAHHAKDRIIGRPLRMRTSAFLLRGIRIRPLDIDFSLRRAEAMYWCISGTPIVYGFAIPVNNSSKMNCECSILTRRTDQGRVSYRTEPKHMVFTPKGKTKPLPRPAWLVSI